MVRSGDRRRGVGWSVRYLEKRIHILEPPRLEMSFEDAI
jgi:hypothetical protein